MDADRGGRFIGIAVAEFAQHVFAPAPHVAAGHGAVVVTSHRECDGAADPINLNWDVALAAFDTGAELATTGHDGDSYGSHAYDFVFPSVAPGNHVVRMQFRGENATGVTVIHHTTVVQYSQ